MIGAGQGALLGYVQEKLIRDPALARERYAGRTLLLDRDEMLQSANAAGIVITGHEYEDDV